MKVLGFWVFGVRIFLFEDGGKVDFISVFFRFLGWNCLGRFTYVEQTVSDGCVVDPLS